MDIKQQAYGEIQNMFLSHLEEPHASKAIANLREQQLMDTWPRIEKDNISQALFFAFNWHETPEGVQYWRNLHKEIDPKFYENRGREYQLKHSIPLQD